MPLFSIKSVEINGGEAKLVGTLSYAKEDSLQDIRARIDKFCAVAFPYDFWDSLSQIRYVRSCEGGMSMLDIGKEVIIIPQVSSSFESRSDCLEVGSDATKQGFHSSKGSNVESNSRASNISAPLSVPTLLSREVNVPDLSLDSEGFDKIVPIQDESGDHDSYVRLELTSKSMKPEHIECWKRNVENLQKFMISKQWPDHKWKVRTWDEEGEPRGKLICEECEYSVALASMEKGSINNSFSNFKSGHLKTNKHHNAWGRKRKITLTTAELKAKCKQNLLDSETQLSMNVKILESVNDENPSSPKSFFITGDLERRPLVLSYYRVHCNFCMADIAALVPQHNNLESNLKEHLAGSRHAGSVQNHAKKLSGQALLSGRPGRPAKIDGRDVRQKTIHGFFGHDLGRPSSSDSSKGKGTSDNEVQNFSQLCWGLWQEYLSWSSCERNVKNLLMDQLRGSDWYPEPYVVGSVYCYSSDCVHEIRGVFRHVECSRISSLGGGFLDLTCEKCWSIKNLSDFRLRIYREEKALDPRGTRDTGNGRRLDFLTIPELRGTARVVLKGLAVERNKNKRLCHRLTMLQTKAPCLREVVGEAASQKDILKFCNAIVSAHKHGAFGGKEALWDLLKDIALNLNRKVSGKRYSEGTKAIMQALLQQGGRRVIDCLYANMLGPSLNTLQRHRRGMSMFRPGLHDDQFKLVAYVYSKIKIRVGIEGDLPCLLAEDETTVKKSVRWVARGDLLIGFCGQLEDHACSTGLEIVVGDGEKGFKMVVDSFELHKIGSMARCVIVNPLHPSFPRLCLLATSTCNAFDSEWVRGQWDSMLLMWNQHCREQVGPVLGHASDGDSRRRKLMFEDMCGLRMKVKRFCLGWEGWILSYSLLGAKNDPYGLHDADYIHNGKKLINPLDSPVKVLRLGAYVATISHLYQVYELYGLDEHKLNREDLKRTDRQNWASAQRLCYVPVQFCLKELRQRGDVRVELTLATELYLGVIGSYIDIFLNSRLTLRNRVVMCAKVSFFFRLWRLWILHGNHFLGGNTQSLSLANTISTQSFLDIQMSCHYVVLLIILFRDKYPKLPIPFHMLGSDACEQFFSKVGEMRGHERNYDFAELIDSATGLNRLAELQLTEGIGGVGCSHKKHKNIWMKIHPLVEDEQIADLTIYEGLETNALVIDALKEGFTLAQNLCVRLHMHPSTSSRVTQWFNEPWVIEANGVEQGSWYKIPVESLQQDGEDGVDEGAVQDSTEHAEDGVQIEGAMQIEADVQIEGSELEAVESDGVSDLVVAEGEFQHVLSSLVGDLNEEDLSPIDPTCSFDGRKIYKSTLVSQLVGNPTLSKDRLTRVKQSVYFNNLVDKPKDRLGARSMWMQPGTEIGVYFIQEFELPSTRASSIIAKGGSSLKGSGKPKRGRPARVHEVLTREKAVWWIGKVQFIRKKYQGRWGRCREAIDLLDRPSTEGDHNACEVQCYWFTKLSRCKFKYDIVDHQWISLDSVISAVSLTTNLQHPGVFFLDEQDARSLDDFVKNKGA